METNADADQELKVEAKLRRWQQKEIDEHCFTTCLFFAQTVSHPITLFICAIGKDKAAAQTLVAGMTMKHVRYY